MGRHVNSRLQKQRSHSLLQELRAAGLIGGLFAGRGQPSAQQALLGGTHGPSRRLRQILDRFGPLFSAFGDYLATRCDALPLADLQELTGVPGELTPSSPRRVQELIQSEAPDDWRDVQIAPGPPLAYTPVFQWHTGQYAGEDVDLLLLRPEFEQQYLHESALLDTLARARLMLHDGERLELADMVADFHVHLDELLDLRRQRENMSALADSSEAFSCWQVSQALEQPNSRRLLLFAKEANERNAETALGALPSEPATEDQDHEDDDLARRLTLVWLQHALLTQTFPHGPLEQSMRLCEQGHFALRGGLCAELDPEQRGDLLRYLTAVARADTVRACEQLLRLCDKRAGACSHETLSRRIREAEPFRSGGWSAEYSGERLADAIFVQWRLASQAGYRLKPHFAAFARGLCVIERNARRIAPQRDGLREGLDDLRVIAATVRAREYFGPANIEESLNQLLETGAALLRKLGDHSYHTDTENDDRDDTLNEHIKNRWVLFAGVLALLASVGLLFERVRLPAVAGVPGEILATALLAGLGLLVLRVISKPYRE